jgi:hypothetical protein
MAYSIVFEGNYRNKFTSKINEFPYIYWMNNTPKEKVIFSYDSHRIESSEHFNFIPSITDNTGIFIYRYSGDYTTINIYAKILIDIDHKILYIYNCITDYDHMSYDSKNDLKFIGGIKAFKKSGDYEDIIKTFTDKFFGKEWRCYSRYKNKNKIKDKKKVFKLLKNFTYLPYDIHEYIADKIIKWKDVQKLTFEEGKNLVNQIEENIGVNISEHSKIYSWHSIIGVYNYDLE